MKIYNLTFCDKMNYGAMLQCFAIQQISSSFGKDVIHLNLVNKFSLKTFLQNFLLRRMIMIFRSSAFIKKRIKSLLLRQNLINFLSNESEDAILLVGSDQVWNPLIKNNPFLCDFSLSNVKKRSYACSLGYFEKDERLNRIIPMIRQFENVSVRELDVFECFEDLVDPSKLTCDLDPTLMVEPSIWEEMARNSRLHLPRHYILVFGIYWSPDFNEHLKKIHVESGLPIISISEDKNIYCTKNMYGVSPIDFLAIILNADYVVTSSYHGTCFSIIFQKPFCALINPNLPSRISSLLKNIGMENRSFDVPIFDLSCSFDAAATRLNTLKAKSLLVLEDILA